MDFERLETPIMRARAYLGNSAYQDNPYRETDSNAFHNWNEGFFLAVEGGDSPTEYASAIQGYQAGLEWLKKNHAEAHNLAKLLHCS